MEGERQYLEDMVQLLQSVQWLHNFPLTQIFTRDVFHQMPEEWRKVLCDLPLGVLNGIPQCRFQTDWPQDLQKYLKECRRLSVHQLLSHHPDHSDNQDIQIPQEFVHKMSVKKKHEVAGVVRLMKSLAEVTGSGHVLDIGSGMGYIDSCLHEVLKLSVLGAEGEERLVSNATKRQTQLSGQCQGVSHIPWLLADDDATLHTAREVIDNLVHLNQPCTCHVKGRGRALDSKESITDDCHESKAIAQKCTGHMENKPQGLESSQTFAAVSGGMSKETALAPIHECTSQINECTETEVYQFDENLRNKLNITKTCQYDENLRIKSSETEACQNNGNQRNKPDISSTPCALDSCSAQALSNGDHDPRNSCMLLGLHACADLSPIMMKMFTACTQVSSLVLLSCCYHKLQPWKQYIQTSDATKQDIQTSDAMKQDIQTSDGTKQDIQTSDGTKQDIQTSDATKQDIQTSDAMKQDIQTSDAMKQDIQTTDATKQEIQTTDATKQDIQTTDATKQEIQTSDATPDHKEERRMRGSNTVLQVEHGNRLDSKSGSHVENGEEETLSTTSTEFANFPMSQTLHAILEQHHFGMTVFGLRVGAQESGLRWVRQTSEHHECHWKNVAYRGLLEVFCQQEGLTLKKRRRRCVRKSQFGNLDEYTETIKESYEFEKIAECPKGLDDITGTPQNSEETSEDFKNVVNRALSSLADALQKEYESHKHVFPLIEPLTGLQLALQPVIEGLVLLDRVAYLKECGFGRVWLEKIFEDELSPRNVALVAVR